MRTPTESPYHDHIQIIRRAANEPDLSLRALADLEGTTPERITEILMDALRRGELRFDQDRPTTPEAKAEEERRINEYMDAAPFTGALTIGRELGIPSMAASAIITKRRQRAAANTEKKIDDYMTLMASRRGKGLLATTGDIAALISVTEPRAMEIITLVERRGWVERRWMMTSNAPADYQTSERDPTPEDAMRFFSAGPERTVQRAASTWGVPAHRVTYLLEVARSRGWCSYEPSHNGTRIHVHEHAPLSAP